jgi:Uncharacterized protein conserved in bacteria (DUF2330)
MLRSGKKVSHVCATGAVVQAKTVKETYMRTAYLVATALLFTTLAAPSVAEACGGCFTVQGGSDSTVVTSHRMAMSISQSQSVLWDQIQYAGNPEEFSWVLPVKPGSVLEVGSDAFFDVLDAGTSTTVGIQSVQCSTGGGSFGGGDDGGFGCGSGNDLSASADGGGFGPPNAVEPDPVTVVSQGTVGPYETVTLSTEQPGALNEWLDSHGYAVPEEIQPTIDDYVAEGFDFIALRLIPGNDVQQMQPVRVVMPGSQLTLPLRLVAAGTGAQTALTLFVLSEGRYEAQNFDNALLPRQDVVWDWNSSSSNYSELRADLLAAGTGHNWLTSYAMNGPLFAPTADGASEQFGDVQYAIPGGGVADTLSRAFFRAAGVDLGVSGQCATAFEMAVEAGLTVVDNCNDDGKCEPLDKGEISVTDLECGGAPDDLAVAMTGLRLSDVWLTRLEADLPRSAFGTDLQLQAASDQTSINSRFMAQGSKGDPCNPSVAGAALGGGRTKKGGELPGGLVGLTLGALGVTLALRRRRTYLAD